VGAEYHQQKILSNKKTAGFEAQPIKIFPFPALGLFDVCQ
jgi:hypothetical protein